MKVPIPSLSCFFTKKDIFMPGKTCVAMHIGEQGTWPRFLKLRPAAQYVGPGLC